jgi:hypothetical protein
LAATAPTLQSVANERPKPTRKIDFRGYFIVSALTVLALIIHRNHPYAEDGGLYLAGVKRLLHPDLYPYLTGFVTAHLRFSLFAPLLVVLVRAFSLGLMPVMLLLYVASIWTTLFAAWQLALRCFPSTEEWYGAVSFLAIMLTVPVAGTSLMLMDPYVSARSISTPCSLLALVGFSDIARRIKGRERPSYKSLVVFLSSLSVGIVVHPLMTGYAIGYIAALAIAALASAKARWKWFVALGLGAIALSIALLKSTPLHGAGYSLVAISRNYWFLDAWHWYEIAGLIAPLVVIAVAWSRARQSENKYLAWLSQMALVMGVLAVIVALLFARAGVLNYAVARLQPLRVFQIVYVLTLLIVGAALGRHVFRRAAWRWVSVLAPVGTMMMFVQIEVFPHSAHLEFPWVAPQNGWEQAFLWIRENTPKDAVFALDAHYITEAGEDSQNFRAIAERSALPDYSKDGGIASIAPDLTADWLRGVATQNGLEQATDGRRIAVLSPASVHWIVLSRSARTNFECDYVNDAAKVCRVAPGARNRFPQPVPSGNIPR